MIGLGCMRLSTAPDRDPARAAQVIAAAVEAGVELFDTADVYCHDDTDLGANESLLANIARTHRVVTKGGLTRPDGAWVPNGRARHLAAAARASRDRLGIAAIELYLLHVIDPKVPLETSLRALVKLRDDGVIRSLGISNVTPTQLDAALAIAPIAAVQVELHPWNLDAVRGGLLARCADRGIELLAYRPLGGTAGVKRAARDPVLETLATRLGATPHEIALAWLRSLSPAITPLPGATRIETARSAIRGQQLQLDDDARATLAAHFLDVARATPSSRASGEVVMILGMPAAGKSTLAEAYVTRGHARLNRDERGGSLLDLARALDEQLAEHPTTSVVVDNTYATRASRAPVIEVARRHGAAVRCIVVGTSIEQAQSHAAWRVLERCGSFDSPAVAKEIRPGVQFRYRRDFEPPSLDEGFTEIEQLAPPRHAHGRHAGLIVELDGIVWVGKPQRPDKIELRPGVLDALASWPLVCATLWRPGLAPNVLADIAARLAELVGRSLIGPLATSRSTDGSLAGPLVASPATTDRPASPSAASSLALDVRVCPHPAGPPVCWCRKPMPGLAIAFARDHDLDPSRTIVLGRGPADRGFALRAGMQHRALEDGWPIPP